MTKLEFPAVEAEELYWHTQVDVFRGLRCGEEVTQDLIAVDPLINEGLEIDTLCQAAKALIGHTAEGFTNATHLMRFISGYSELPPQRDEPEGDTGVLVCT